MRTRPARLLARAALLVGVASAAAPGCGPATPPTGTQIDITIPKEQAEKQNRAYQDYAKQKSAPRK